MINIADYEQIRLAFKSAIKNYLEGRTSINYEGHSLEITDRHYIDNINFEINGANPLGRLLELLENGNLRDDNHPTLYADIELWEDRGENESSNFYAKLRTSKYDVIKSREGYEITIKEAFFSNQV